MSNPRGRPKGIPVTPEHREVMLASLAKAREVSKLRRAERQQAKLPISNVVDLQQPKASKSAHKAIRQAITLLDSFYDEGLGRYKQQYSDARIAKETGLSIQAIVEIRQDAYKPMRTTNPELIKEVERLKGDVASLSDMLTELRTRLKKLELALT